MSINVKEYHNLTVACDIIDKILPCPFCGTKPKSKITPKFGEFNSHYVIYCPNSQCSAAGAERCYCHVEEMNKEEAIKRWNNRLVLFISATNFIEEKLKDNFEIQSIERISLEKMEVSFCEGGKYTRFSNGSWCDSDGYLDNKLLENELEKSYRKFCGVC